MKNLGIIGGLGPMATVYFMELIIKGDLLVKVSFNFGKCYIE